MKAHVLAVSITALALGLLLTACSSRACRPCDDARVPDRQFLVLQARPIPDPQAGITQVFVDGKIVSVPGRERVQVLDRVASVAGTAAPVWSAESPAQDVSFGPQARELNSPKILAIDGQDATVFVGENNEDGSIRNGWHLAITPTVRSEQIHMTVAYQHHEDGKLIDSVPPTAISGPAGRVFIIESRPARTQ